MFFDNLTRFVTSNVLKKVTIGFGAFIHKSNAISLVVSFGFISTAITISSIRYRFSVSFDLILTRVKSGSKIINFNIIKQSTTNIVTYYLGYFKAKKKDCCIQQSFLCSGNVLLSRAVARQVPSALKSLTSVFGMGTGGSSSLLSPDLSELIFNYQLNNAKNLVSHSLFLSNSASSSLFEVKSSTY